DGAKVKVTSTRFVSIAFKELYANKLTFENLGSEPVTVEVDSVIDADVYNEDANYDEQFWNVLSKQVSAKDGRLVAQTIPNNFGTPQCTTEMAMHHVTDMEAKGLGKEEDKQVVNTFAKELAANEQVAFEKRVIVTTSRDYADEKDLDEATSKLLDLQAEKTFSELLTAMKKHGIRDGKRLTLRLKAVTKHNKVFVSTYSNYSQHTMVMMLV